MKFFVYKQELHFCQGDGYFWIIRLQYLEVCSPKMYKFLVEKYKFSIFAYEIFKVKLKNCK